ncbi:MAG: M3 family oligoendopeptidase [Candidatus Cohnella colombiensis]|uniref:M3 family oligoendopeptidase n=1 Tax=Candidatus Cohnella colombiensis TaxID=3121368 RepID=A0AA95EVD2_9BACL|nr:MAG: M3 family oligoendopeptidase [Cohnella sp.]
MGCNGKGAISLNKIWDLESLFVGGSSSVTFLSFLEETEQLTKSLLHQLQEAENESTVSNATLNEWTDKLQLTLARISEADAFLSCLTSQQMSDKRAVALSDRVTTLSAKFKQASDLYDALLAKVPVPQWEEWINQSELAKIKYPLNERRETALDKMSPALESVVSELSVDGYHGWGEHYNTIVSGISIPWTEASIETTLSVGQAANKLDDPNPDVRNLMSAKWEEAWAAKEDLCSDTLNRLSGFRLKLYAMRNWSDPLQEPLRINRMSKATLDAMWSAVAEGIDPLKKYLSLKAKLIGKERLAWHDIDASLTSSKSNIPYEEAAEIILDAFEQFSPDLAKLAKKAFDDRWIEAEDRSGKRPGGFCTSFPLSRQSRIFMTYSGTPGNVSTLAHELGHAYHGALVESLPPMAQQYAMNVAETASTFAEALVSDALLRRASSKEEQLSLLDDRLQRAVAFLMNIRARFLFETRMYNRRSSGMLDADQLNELMVEAQKEAFGDALDSWHPHFWASKLHFYLTDVPFYNFPYTFGYLFSTGLIAVAERDADNFPERYKQLLKDTGVMTVEQLSKLHLGVDLENPGFWRDAVSTVIADVERFAELCDK